MSRSSAHDNLARLGATGRRAAHAGNWAVVSNCVREIQRLDKREPDGWFLAGLLEKANGRRQQAFAAFAKTLQLDARRYDAAVEMAALCQVFMRHREAVALLRKYEPRLDNSPYYLDMAGTTYTRLGLHARAWAMFSKANELQPNIDHFQANLAACAVNLGKLEKAGALYRELLQRHPDHQRNHFELARLETATDTGHIDRMKKVLEDKRLPPEKNIFLYYAIAKELEDLGEWEEAFEFYEKGGNAAAGVAAKAGYEVGRDIELIDGIIDSCDAGWLVDEAVRAGPRKPDRVPIFIVGLPRTGTTLTERIVASHSHVESADETFFMQIAVRRAAGPGGPEEMTPGAIAAAAGKPIRAVVNAYLEFVEYRLGGLPMFIDKYPFNFLYLGFIAKGLPQAKIVHLRRHPMDACFAMYKQSYFRQAYTLGDLGEYYLAYDRLFRHWRALLGDRIVEVAYEELVAEPETEIRRLLERLGLEFEPACLAFHENPSPSATASKVQVRERVHSRSVGKWKNWERQLEPLRQRLEEGGVDLG